MGHQSHPLFSSKREAASVAPIVLIVFIVTIVPIVSIVPTIIIISASSVAEIVGKIT